MNVSTSLPHCPCLEGALHTFASVESNVFVSEIIFIVYYSQYLELGFFTFNGLVSNDKHEYAKYMEGLAQAL